MPRPSAETLELPEPPAPGEPYLLLSVRGRSFGVSLRRVREVITPRPYTPLPGAPAAVRGLVNLRGRIVTVVDMAAALGAERAAEPSDGRIVVVEHGPTQVGIAVDEVTRVVKVPSTGGEPRSDEDARPEVADAEGHTFTLLEPASLLDPVLA